MVSGFCNNCDRAFLQFTHNRLTIHCQTLGSNELSKVSGTINDGTSLAQSREICVIEHAGIPNVELADRGLSRKLLTVDRCGTHRDSAVNLERISVDVTVNRHIGTSLGCHRAGRIHVTFNRGVGRSNRELAVCGTRGHFTENSTVTRNGEVAGSSERNLCQIILGCGSTGRIVGDDLSGVVEHQLALNVVRIRIVTELQGLVFADQRLIGDTGNHATLRIIRHNASQTGSRGSCDGSIGSEKILDLQSTQVKKSTGGVAAAD